MKTLIQAVVVTLFASSAAQAQQAVQWKVSDGGNGHWYGAEYQFRLWADAKLYAESVGGHLATTTSQPELDALRPLINNSSGADYWLGASRSTNAGPWLWVTSEPFSSTHWAPGEPDNGPESICLEVIGQPASANFNLWNDETYYAWGGGNYSIIEWSADCNNDGIVDYGQCRDGTLPDYNGNNIPDCCESATPCVIGNYPVQWRVAEGGNGHWYKVDRFGGQLSWASASLRAQDAGGHLACLSSAHENSFVFSLIASDPSAWNDKNGPWIGARREGGMWSWVNGEAWSFTNWCGGTGTVEHRGQYWACSGTTPSNDWNDHFGDVGPVSGPLMPVAAMIEWSADCNADGIVDYGQILQGQLADANQDGISDVCQQPTCANADIYRDFNVNGADLGILLSQWGPNTPLTESDLNNDGVVNGADLGLLLSFWGACP